MRDDPIRFLREISGALAPGASLDELTDVLRRVRIRGRLKAREGVQFADWLSLVARSAEASQVRIGPLVEAGEVAGRALAALIRISGDHALSRISWTDDRALYGPVLPGTYSVRHVTGRLLWEDRLDESSLLWRRAFPERPMPAAAQTHPSRQRPASQKFALLDGSIELRVLPGLLQGQLELHRVPSEEEVREE